MKLTKKEFDKIERGQIFASGVLPNSPTGLFMTDTGGNFDLRKTHLRWIAKKGYGYDWAIFCHWDGFTELEVASIGDKVTSKQNIQKCVPCDDDVLNLYRY